MKTRLIALAALATATVGIILLLAGCAGWFRSGHVCVEGVCIHVTNAPAKAPAATPRKP